MNQALDMDRLLGALAASPTIRRQIEGLDPMAVETRLAREAGRLGKALTPDTLTMFWPMLIGAVVWQVPEGEPISEEAIRGTLEPFFRKFVQDLPASGAARPNMPSGKGLPAPAGMSLGEATFGDVTIEVDGGSIARLAGTRMKVSQIALEHTRQGLTPEQIRENHPHLSLGQVLAALAFYYGHRDMVEAQIAASLAYADRARQEAGPSPLTTRLRAQGRLPAERAA